MGDSIGLRGKRCELNFADWLSVSSSAVLQKVIFNVCNYCHAAIPELEISTVLFAPRLFRSDISEITHRPEHSYSNDHPGPSAGHKSIKRPVRG